jgi:hypothetical protein
MMSRTPANRSAKNVGAHDRLAGDDAVIVGDFFALDRWGGGDNHFHSKERSFFICV